MNQLLQITIHQSGTLYLNQFQVPFSQMTKYVSSTAMKQNNSSSGASINTPVPEQSISSASIDQTNRPSGTANNNLLLPKPQPSFEQDYSLDQADDTNNPASCINIPAMCSETSSDTRSRQKHRKRHNLVTRLQSVVCRRIFSSLREKFKIL